MTLAVVQLIGAALVLVGGIGIAFSRGGAVLTVFGVLVAAFAVFVIVVAVRRMRRLRATER